MELKAEEMVPVKASKEDEADAEETVEEVEELSAPL